jgi:hypothetical protein
MPKPSDQVLKEKPKTYLIRRKISWGMICTFVISLLLILIVSISFFFFFLDQTLEMSVVSIFISHTHSIVGDIIQVKKNDFMLAQNELKIASALIVSLVMDRNFNKKSLGGPNLNDLSRFKKYCSNAYLYQKSLETTK